MPSASTPCMSDSLLITTSWPIAATGIVPACLRLTVNLAHDAGTVIEPTLNCIASLPSMVVAQSLTTAAGLSLPVVAAGARAATVLAAGGVDSAGIAVVAAGGGVAAGSAGALA